MPQRDYFAFLEVGVVAAAGCLHDDSGDDGGSPDASQTFDGCNMGVIYEERLPEEVQREVNTAFDDDVYESDEELHWEQIEGQADALYRDGGYYEPTVDGDTETRTLRFEETSVNEPFLFIIHTRPDTNVTGSVIVEGEEGSLADDNLSSVVCKSIQTESQ